MVVVLFGCAHWHVVSVLRGPVNEDVFAAPPFHGGKIMDSDIQEISEQIHRLLLQVRKHSLDQSTQALLQALVSLRHTLISALSQSITWAPAVTAATEATAPMNSR